MNIQELRKGLKELEDILSINKQDYKKALSFEKRLAECEEELNNLPDEGWKQTEVAKKHRELLEEDYNRDLTISQYKDALDETRREIAQVRSKIRELG